MLIINLYGCGYTPSYKFNENMNFKAVSISYEGDRMVNQFLRSKFTRLLSVDSDTKFKIDIDSSLEKREISKNSKGEIDTYNLVVSVTIKVEKVNTDKELEISESFIEVFNYKEEFLQQSQTDKFKERAFGESIVRNLTDTIFDKFILSIAKNK